MELEFGIETAAKREVPENRSVRTLTCKQISMAVEEEIGGRALVDDVEIFMVKASGFAIEIKTTSSGTIFVLDDTTEKIECILWSSGVSYDIVVRHLSEKKLVSVMGTLKIQNKRKTVVVTAIAECDGNQLIYSLANSLYQHLYLTNEIKHEGLEKESLTAIGTREEIKNEIMDTFRNNQDENGLELEMVVSILGGKYGEKKVRDEIENLVGDCYLYCVEGNSYKTTF